MIYVAVEYMLKGRKRMAVPVTRQSLLAKSSHAAPKPYHPEMDNYEVMSVIAGMTRFTGKLLINTLGQMSMPLDLQESC